MAGLVPQVATVGAHAAADGGSPPVRASGVLLPAGPVRTRRVMPNRCLTTTMEADRAGVKTSPGRHNRDQDLRC